LIRGIIRKITIKQYFIIGLITVFSLVPFNLEGIQEDKVNSHTGSSNLPSILILTIETPLAQGLARGDELVQLLQEVFEDKIHPNLEELIYSKGGTWKIIRSANTIQVGLFLPFLPIQAEEITTVFLKHLSVRLEHLSLSNRSADLSDVLLSRIHITGVPAHDAPILHPGATTMGGSIERPNEAFLKGESDKNLKYPKVSVFLNGPLVSCKSRIMEVTKSFLFPPFSFSIDAGNEIVIPKQPPILIRICTWENPRIGDFVSAKFIGEKFLKNSQTDHSLNFDIWPSSGKLVLTLLATVPIDRLSDTAFMIDDFLGSIDEFKSSPGWSFFCQSFQQVMQADARDLEKQAFLEAWLNHFSLENPETASFTFRSPNRIEKLSCLPEKRLHSIIWDDLGNPAIAAVRTPGSGQSVDLCLAIKESPTVNTGLLEKMQKENLIDHPGISLEPSTDGIIKIKINLEKNAVSQTIYDLRSLLFSAIHENSGSSTASLSNMNFPAKIAIVAVGSMETFELFSKLKDGWPPYSSIQTPVSLDKKKLAYALDGCASFTDSIKGRWSLKTSTAAGLAETLAKLACLDVHLDDLKQIERLLSTP